jgi:hypothetical protein
MRFLTAAAWTSVRALVSLATVASSISSPSAKWSKMHKNVKIATRQHVSYIVILAEKHPVK